MIRYLINIVYLIVAVLSLFTYSPARAQPQDNPDLRSSSFYQNLACADFNGTEDVWLANRRHRVDCMSKDLAIKISFAYNAYHSLEEALGYLEETNKHVAILFVFKDYRSSVYVDRVIRKIRINRYKISVWAVRDRVLNSGITLRLLYKP